MREKEGSEKLSNSSHPDKRTLERWVSNLLTPTEMDQLDRHLQRCEVCAELLEKTLQSHSHPLAGQLSSSGSFDSLGSNGALQVTEERTRDSHHEMNNANAEPPFEIIDIYESGGIGKVWRAYERRLNRIIAVKKLRKDISDNQSVQQRFIREARITGQLSHPGIVPVYQFLEQGKQSCYSMPLLSGTTLTNKIVAYHQDRLQKEERFSDFVRLLESFVSICNTVAYAHSKDVIHRDLKSDNVMLGEFGEVTVLDWGLAKSLEDDAEEIESVDVGTLSGSSSSTIEGQRLGTPSFMSPEQASGHLNRVGKHSDIYCLAGILYEILTGHPPFAKQDIESTISAVIYEAVERPSKRNPHSPAELEDICLAGLSKEASQRPRSAKVIGKKVRDWLSDQAERKRNEQERQRFFAMSVDMLAILDSECRICEANDAWLSALGFKREELIGKSFLDWAHPENKESTLEFLSKARRVVSLNQNLRLDCKRRGLISDGRSGTRCRFHRTNRSTSLAGTLQNDALTSKCSRSCLTQHPTQ